MRIASHGLSRLRKKGAVGSVACLPVVLNAIVIELAVLKIAESGGVYARCTIGAQRIRLRMRTKL
jgi:hypothetical protein